MEALPTGGFSRPEQASFQECTATFTKIRVDIHTTDAQGVAFHGENHVTIILLVDEGKSIEIEMTAKKSSRMGQLCWRWYESRNSKSERLVYQFPTPVTVKALYRAIRAWGFDQYLFASNGLGRQFWTYQLLVKLAEDERFMLPTEALVDAWRHFQTSYFPTEEQSNEKQSDPKNRVAFLGRPEWYDLLSKNKKK